MKRELLVFAFLLALTGKAANSSTIALPGEKYTASFANPPVPGIMETQNVPIDNTWGNGMTNATTIANSQMVSTVGSATSCCSFLPSGTGFNASASARYEVYIDPTGEAHRDISQVPIIVAAGVRADCSGSVQAATASQAIGHATVEIDGLLPRPTFLTALCSSRDSNPHDAEFLDTPELFPISTFIPVTIFAGGTVSAASSLFLTSTASIDLWADPTFQIDPSFPFASDYRILISPSGVSTDLPEPVSFISVGLGLAGVGLKRRLNRRLLREWLRR